MRRICTLGLAVLAYGFATVSCDGGEADDGNDESQGETGEPTRTDNVLMLDGDPANGEEEFTGRCSQMSCHGTGGTMGAAPSLADRVPNLGDRDIVDVLVMGKNAMPPQADLSDQEMADVLAYVTATY
jgi:predicted CxxxxCH...CXXCH cytochrome family protein